MGDAVDEVDGAIQRVDDPSPPRGRCSRGSFLGEDAVFGQGGPNDSDHGSLCGAVHLGDRIDHALHIGGGDGPEAGGHDVGSRPGRP